MCMVRGPHKVPWRVAIYEHPVAGRQMQRKEFGCAVSFTQGPHKYALEKSRIFYYSTMPDVELTNKCPLTEN